MKSSSSPSVQRAFGAAVMCGVLFACSSSPSLPPIQTNDGQHPGVGGGGTTPTSDGGTPVVTDSGTDSGGGGGTDGGAVEGGVCTGGNCGGCCDALNRCLTGTLNAACGVLGVACQTCGTGFTCTAGFCE